MKLSELIDLFYIYLNAAGRSPITIQSYQARFNRWLAWFGADTPLAAITPERLDQWAASLRQAQELYKGHSYRQTVNRPLKPHSVYGYIQSVKTLLKWAFERGYSQINLGQHLQKPRLNHSSHDKIINREDLYRLLDAARPNARDFAILAFLVDTGCRRGEVATLRLSGLMLDRLEAVVNGKTGQHTVVFTSQTAAALAAWLCDRPSVDHDCVFTGLPHALVNEPGQPIKPGAINSLLRRLAKRAGITRRVNPHSIRHLIGQLYTDRTNLALAKEKLNHASIVTTGMIYAHQDTTRVKAATDLYSPLNEYLPQEDLDQLFIRETNDVNSD
jgi:integrase/recombinase XerD